MRRRLGCLRQGHDGCELPRRWCDGEAGGGLACANAADANRDDIVTLGSCDSPLPSPHRHVIYMIVISNIRGDHREMLP